MVKQSQKLNRRKIPGWSPDGPRMTPGWSKQVEQKVEKKFPGWFPDGPRMIPGWSKQITTKVGKKTKTSLQMVPG